MWLDQSLFSQSFYFYMASSKLLYSGFQKCSLKLIGAKWTYLVIAHLIKSQHQRTYDTRSL